MAILPAKQLFYFLLFVVVIVRNIIFPRLLEFEPDLIMLSAGFDAHKKDLINSGYIALVWLFRICTSIAEYITTVFSMYGVFQSSYFLY